MNFAITDDYIELNKLLKATGLCFTGGEAHTAVELGEVLVDDQIESRKRAKIRPGQTVTLRDQTVTVTAAE